LILATTGVQVDVRGLDGLDPRRTYVFVSNHQSIYDIPVLFQSLPFQLRIIAKASLGRFPILGWHLQRTGHMLVDRRRPDRSRIFAWASRLTANGLCLIVFPEGTRSPDGRVGTFKGGSFLVALEAGLPVVPISVVGSRHVMLKGRLATYPGVVLASSGAIYGRQNHQPVRETDTPNLDSPYAISKWSAEQYVHTIGKLWGIETVALRIFNAYGPGQSLPVSHAPVVPRFMKAAVSGGSIVIFGDGQQSRDFIYVADVVQALIQAATAGNVNRMVLNIGSGQETTVNELVNTIESTTGLACNRVWNRGKQSGVRRLVADIHQAQVLLGFRPKTTLAEGLRVMLVKDPRFQMMELALA
jgi:UDP-glucose 4-epimerase